MRMPFELFVALRYLFSRRKQTFIYIISIMSILGVALGVGALVVVLGVYNGLTTDMRDKIIGANAHGIVMSYVPAAFQQHPDLVRRVEAVEHVRGATPFIYTEVMLSAAGGVKGGFCSASKLLKPLAPPSSPPRAPSKSVKPIKNSAAFQSNLCLREITTVDMPYPSLSPPVSSGGRILYPKSMRPNDRI